MTAETAPTSVGLTADQVLTLLATWLREQGLTATSMSQMTLSTGVWYASFVIEDDAAEEWSDALDRPFRIASRRDHWWHAIDTDRGYPQVDGIKISVCGEHHPNPMTDEARRSLIALGWTPPAGESS